MTDVQNQPQTIEKFPRKRVFAFGIDLLFAATVSRVLLGGLIPLSLVFEPLYFLVRDALFKGRSVGKLIIGLAVVDLDGNRCTLAKSMLRNLIFTIPGIAVAFQLLLGGGNSLRILSVIFLIEFFAMVRSQDGRRLGDHLAKTQVVDRRPNIKDSRFLWLSLLLVFVFFLAEPLVRFMEVEREAKGVVRSIEEYKGAHGHYPEELDSLKKKPRGDFIYTRYETYQGSPEFFLTGIAVPHPRKISYSSQRKEWRIHRGNTAWTPLELGIDRISLEAEGHYRRANALEKRELWDQAMQEYREAVRLKADYLNARLGLALSLKQKGLLDDALREYQGIAQWKPDQVEAHLNRFLILYREKRYAEALEAHKTFLKLAPRTDEEERKLAEATNRFMEEQIKLGTGKTEGPLVAAPVVPEKVREKQESVRESVARLPAGTKATLVLKTGSWVSGRIGAKDGRGFWLEIGKGAQAYFSNTEIQQVTESQGFSDVEKNSRRK